MKSLLLLALAILVVVGCSAPESGTVSPVEQHAKPGTRGKKP